MISASAYACDGHLTKKPKKDSINMGIELFLIEWIHYHLSNNFNDIEIDFESNTFHQEKYVQLLLISILHKSNMSDTNVWLYKSPKITMNTSVIKSYSFHSTIQCHIPINSIHPSAKMLVFWNQSALFLIWCCDKNLSLNRVAAWIQCVSIDISC